MSYKLNTKYLNVWAGNGNVVIATTRYIKPTCKEQDLNPFAKQSTICVTRQ